jgi:hypothetical protein
VGIEQSPRRLAGQRTALREFDNAYVEYLEAGPIHPNAGDLRSRVLQLIPSAQSALNEADVGVVVRTPPALPGNYVYEGLSNTAFLHEQSGVYEGVPQHVRDVLGLAMAQLERLEQQLARKRRNPLYWGDRVVSAVLRFPAYLVAKIVGVPTARIDRSVWGTLLRLLEILAAALGIYFGGSAAGWW